MIDFPSSQTAQEDEDVYMKIDDELENVRPATKKVTTAVAKRAAVTKKTATPLTDGTAVEEIYQKKTQLEHILLRPDTYIGSVEHISQPMWVYDQSADRMVQKNISFVPGFFKIFDEILVNAADNKIRDANMDTIKVDIDAAKGQISIYNNGRGIPVVMHAKEGVYVPELIFGHLLTSSNYDDKTKKITGGRNGYGAKLCNIFSIEFIVETADGQVKKRFKQTFSKNMSVMSAPVITDWSKEEYSRITFKPDLQKFGMSEFDADIVSLFHKRVIDLAGCLKDVKVFYNGERIKVKNFKQYVELYLKPNSVSSVTDGNNETLAVSAPTTSSVDIIHQVINDRWEVCVAASDGQFQQVSFVNSINTYKGGTHVNHVVDQIVTLLVEAAIKKNKSLQLKPFQVKNHIFVFILCNIENPAFDSQTKENLTLKESQFGSKCPIPEEFVKKIISKSPVLDNVLQWAKFKQDQQLKKTDGSKKTRVSGIAKLDDANMAGTKQAAKCTLILTEGDSAKALAVSGLSVIGRDNWGVFPLRGKLLNVREAAHKQIMENAEINALKQILGLQHGKAYTSVESLRYGRLMIMTDQDHDGSHIKGLIINFLDHFWPSLLKIPGFLVEFITPIVKCTKGKQEVSFFTLPEYEQWREANGDGKGWNIKYYKGLGTSTAAEAKAYFSNLPVHLKEFSCAESTDRDLIEMAFSKKMADRRKDWLRDFVPGTFVDHRAARIALSDFINRELILFSMADNVRSIPSAVDGLKPGHRKILFACFKRNLKSEIKVAQLAGYVAEHSAYHHGEQSLCATIVGLAQNFIGSNNVNLLEPNGQFGTRLQGGKDAASPRYIFTNLSPFARLLYREEDDALLNFLNEDGQSIEPEWYLPIIPMVLVNGGEGIGTGWSTFIPNYNPADICTNLMRMLSGEEPSEMHPWYHGFGGEIVPQGRDKYVVRGKWSRVSEGVIDVTELPVGTWTQTYKETLEGMMTAAEGKQAEIKEFTEYHTDTTVHFRITLSPSLASLSDAEMEKKFKLTTTISIGNLVTFDRTGRIHKYSDPLAILRDFYDIRLEYYHKRKEHLTAALERAWTILDNKARFIREVVSGAIIVAKKSKEDIVRQLHAGKYFATNESSESFGGFDYLLSMPIHSLTTERIAKLEDERSGKEAELKGLLAKTPKDMWMTDLEEFMKKWNEHSTEQQSAAVSSKKNHPTTAKTAGKGKKKVIESEEDEDVENYKPKASTKRTRTISSSASSNVASKQTMIASFLPPSNSNSSQNQITKNEVIVEENDMDLPLAQRIAKMLGKKV